MLLLPQSGNSLLNVIDKLDDKTLVEYQKVKSKEVELEIPKFTVRSDVNLNPVLRDVSSNHHKYVNVHARKLNKPGIIGYAWLVVQQ